MSSLTVSTESPWLNNCCTISILSYLFPRSSTNKYFWWYTTTWKSQNWQNLFCAKDWPKTTIMNYHYINTCQWLITYKNEVLVNTWTFQHLKTAMGMENGIKISELLFCDMYCEELNKEYQKDNSLRLLSFQLSNNWLCWKFYDTEY